jgi:hypothetical protein
MKGKPCRRGKLATLLMLRHHNKEYKEGSWTIEKNIIDHTFLYPKICPLNIHYFSSYYNVIILAGLSIIILVTPDYSVMERMRKWRFSNRIWTRIAGLAALCRLTVAGAGRLLCGLAAAFVADAAGFANCTEQNGVRGPLLSFILCRPYRACALGRWECT